MSPAPDDLYEVMPRAAATLVILRDGEEGPEVLVTVRPRSMRFMGGATVFPGGAVAQEDLDPAWERASTLDRGEAAQRLSIEAPEALGTFVCALREAFEEVGFVIGPGTDRLRREQAEDPAHFLAACLEERARLGTDELVPAGRWVTPMGAPVRFDARFFLARAPEGWEATPDPTEVEACRWVSPERVLDDLAGGRALMAPPTIEMLQRLAGHADVGAIMASLEARSLSGPGDVISVALSPFVHVVLAPNPGPMTGPGTNTYVVGAGPTCVIDPAVDDARYLDEVVAVAGEVHQILITHRHEDHVGGAAALAAKTRAPVRAFGRADAGGVSVVPIEEGEIVEVGGARLATLYCPGHASDHLCWMLEGAASLFAGDNVLGEGTAVIAPPDGNMRAYLETLERLSRLHIDRIYPGHFRPLDGGNEVLRGYLAHRAEREGQVLEALASGRGTPAEMVAAIYVDTPPYLHPVAEYQVLAHLEMLEARGLVQRDGERWKALPR